MHNRSYIYATLCYASAIDCYRQQAMLVQPLQTHHVVCACDERRGAGLGQAVALRATQQSIMCGTR